MLKDDGDIIRGLGFLTLYAAYFEEAIDDLLVKLEPVKDIKDKQPWYISEKIKQAKKLLKKLDKEKCEDLINNLDICPALFKHRNKLIHGRIYGRNDRPDILKSGKPNDPDREIVSSELYQLATEFFMAAFDRPMIFEISKALNDYKPKTENRKPKTGF
jgi:hypothetical protein